MKAFVHLLAAVALFLMTIIIHWLHNNNNLGDLDTVRIRRRDIVDMEFEDVLEVLNPSSPLFPTNQCLLLTNLSSNPACLASRQTVQNQILYYMNCTNFKSQSCSYISQAVQTLAQKNGTIYTGKVMSQDYITTLIKIIADAPRIFRNAYVSVQESKMIISRSYLYVYLNTAVLANLIFHMVDYFMPVTHMTTEKTGRWGALAVKTLFMLITLLIPAIKAMNPDQPHNAFVMILLTIPAGIAFIWYEILLPKDGKPWIHPFTFFVVFNCSFLLALVENGVTSNTFIYNAILLACAASQSYMSLSWYWIARTQKTNTFLQNAANETIEKYYDNLNKHTPHHNQNKFALRTPENFITEMYTSKATNFGLIISLSIIPIVAIIILTAPIDLTFNAPFILISPIILALLAIISITWLQHLNLQDSQAESGKGWHEMSNAKLYVSLFLIGFATVLSFSLFMEHTITFRAEQSRDKWNTDWILYNTAVSGRQGTGLVGIQS